MKKFSLYLLSGFLLAAPLIEAQESGVVFLNKGLMKVKNDNTANTSIYIKGDMMAKEVSKIYIKQANMKLAGDLVNNVASDYHVFANEETDQTNGSFEFAGTADQRIRGSADKGSSFIRFPKQTILNNRLTGNEKNSQVILEAAMGATMSDIIHKSGRLVLSSKAVTGDNRASQHAHLLLTGTQSGAMYYQNNTLPWGGVQVDLATGGSDQKGKLFGFASPFEQTYADYFTFNFLSAPSPKGLFGDDGLLITNPKTVLQKGKGYIVGMELVNPSTYPTYYASMLDPAYKTAKFADRATDLFTFGGFDYTTKNSIRFTPTASRYTGEKLVTESIPVTLKKGFNYLGNSFTAPLDMTSFTDNTAHLDPDWGVYISSNTEYGVKNRFYVLSNGTGTYSGNNRFTFSVSYLLGQKIGGTLYELGPGNYTNQLLIAPMQMFVIYSYTDGLSLTIPSSKRTHGKVNFLRSGEEDSVIDELLIQTKDTKTEGFDRLTVVFRDDATLRSDDPYDAEKIFNRSGGVNQIYTRSSDNKLLTANILSPETKELAMYFEPCVEPQQVELTAHRLASLQSIRQVVLEDTQTGVRTDLTRTPSYTFLSYPGDKTDRFVLHFHSTPTGAEEMEAEPTLRTYYAGGVIYTEGLRETAIGKDLSVYNMQGQLLHKEAVQETAPCRIAKTLGAGVYMVKIEGYPQTMKFPVKSK